MADNIVITGQIVTSISKRDVELIMPVGIDCITNSIFEIPDDVMLSEQKRLDEQINALEELRKDSRMDPDDLCDVLGEWDPADIRDARNLQATIKKMLSNFDNDFSRHSRIILELLDALLMDILDNEDGNNLVTLRRNIHHWKTNLTAIRKAFK